MTGQNRFALGKAGMEIGHPVSRGTLKSMAPDMEYTIVPFPARQAGTAAVHGRLALDVGGRQVGV